jgi:hypothetical protein
MKRMPAWQSPSQIFLPIMFLPVLPVNSFWQE